MTPHDVLLVLEGYKAKSNRDFEQRNVEMYIQGRYFADALLCTVGNMFSKKGAKPLEYPKEPYEFQPKVLTQEQKDAQVAQIFANLERMKSNFEKAHKQGGD